MNLNYRDAETLGYKTFCERARVGGHLQALGGQLARHRHSLVDEIGLVVARAPMVLRLELWRVWFAVADLPPPVHEKSDSAHPQNEHKNYD